MGTTQGYFLSWWQLTIVIMEQPNEMLRGLRISKVNRELLATLMEILVIGDNHKVLNLVFHSVCQSAWPRYNIQQCHCFIDSPAHNSC